MNQDHRIPRMTFASVFPHYVAKVERKGRTEAEVYQIVCWLTGYDMGAVEAHIERKTDFEGFFAQAPSLNPNAMKVTGSICGYKVQEIQDPLVRKVRILDKLIDELAQGKAMEKILRA
jgi:hypothetical protein